MECSAAKLGGKSIISDMTNIYDVDNKLMFDDEMLNKDLRNSSLQLYDQQY